MKPEAGSASLDLVADALASASITPPPPPPPPPPPLSPPAATPASPPAAASASASSSSLSSSSSPPLVPPPPLPLPSPLSPSPSPPLTLVIDVGYGFPPNPKPRKERINAVARQTVNALKTTMPSLSSSPPLLRYQVVGAEADLEALRKRMTTLLEAELGVSSLHGLTYHAASLESHCAGTAAVYLSPDVEPLDASLPPPSTLVIGGIIDRAIVEDRSKKRAAACLLPSRCLPLSLSSLSLLQDSEPLNVDTVLELCEGWRRESAAAAEGGGGGGGGGGEQAFVNAVGEAMERHEERHPNRPVHKPS